MDDESVDASSHSSVSSLKSRFEQLATRDGKTPAEERTQLGLGVVRPVSRERPHSSEEQKPRMSGDSTFFLGF